MNANNYFDNFEVGKYLMMRKEYVDINTGINLPSGSIWKIMRIEFVNGMFPMIQVMSDDFLFATISCDYFREVVILLGNKPDLKTAKMLYATQD